METVLEFKDINKSYGDKVVHVDIDLEVHKGEILTLMGGSGSGKSVLLRSVIGLEKPNSGSIMFEGQDVTKLNEEQLVPIRKRIAYCFQNGALFDSLTVEENLAYPLVEHTELTDEQISQKIDQTLAKIGLSGSEKLLPSDLSGGMQKRVGVARAIIMDPQVVLYDEPTSGLDPFNTRQILSIVKQLKDHGTTSILVTHDMSSLFTVTDRIAFLKDGRIRALGTAEEIKNTKDATVRAFISGDEF